MSTFKPTVAQRFPFAKGQQSKEALYWKNFEFPVVVKEYGAVSDIDFCPVEPFSFAASCSTRVQIYNPVTNQVDKTISRFKGVAYGASYRHDGKLMIAGGEEAYVRLFDISGRAVLRIFKGHDGPVHVTKFAANNQVMSCSDDKTVRCWDIPSEEEVVRFADHKDYVRCGVVSPSSKDLWLTGSYDHSVKLHDLRTGTSILSVDHGQPVERVLMFPSGGVFLSAGGNYVKVWDALAGGRLLATLSNHHKTITAMCFNANCSRLLTGSLGRHVKVYDVSTYEVVASMSYPASILSMGLSPDDKTLVVGATSGLLSIRHRKPDKEMEGLHSKQRQRGRRNVYMQGRVFTQKNGNLIVKPSTKARIEKYDRMLQRFQHSKALDAALHPNVRLRSPEISFSIFRELIRRGVVHSALSGRDRRWLCIVLTFLKKHLPDTNYTSTVIDITDILLDIYGEVMGENEEVLKRFQSLQLGIQQELKYHTALEEIRGMLDTVLAASQAPPPPPPTLPSQGNSFHPAETGLMSASPDDLPSFMSSRNTVGNVSSKEGDEARELETVRVSGQVNGAR
ncbi:U3 small nucleolar RNA-associated protein 15 homolog [Diadema antillarum]|uniref:U3 small nucleolar RNA-associated protein 15 homolog n=1 Tax=Diadema antillarum TaxID=105358 RepID=UPI003A8561E4